MSILKLTEMIPFVNIHTHSENINKEEYVEIRNIDVDNIVNVNVSHFYSIGIHPWKVVSEDLRNLGIEELCVSVSRCLGD